MRKAKSKYGLKVFLLVMAMVGWVAVPFLTQNKVEAGNVPILVRTANLVAPSGSINPHGAGEYQLYESGQRELEIEIEDVNLADGTVLNFFVDGNQVGQMGVVTQRARLKLRTEDGQTVPVVNDGSTVDVRNGSTILVAGVFGGGGATPTPTASASVSPTASPSGSPTASPSASPSASPTASPSGSPSPSPSANPNERFAGLSGTIGGVMAFGYSEYEIHSSRTELETRVRQVNLPAGTSLSVVVDGVTVGQMVIDSSREGRLRLRSDRGETVPQVNVGSTIQLRQGSTTVMSGTYAASGGSPTPSPSPSGSPSPGLGRYFETNMTAGSATGEVKVFLNTTETQATIVGEFHNLSGNQTSGNIQVDVGGDIITVHSFPVIGGTNGNFPTATINISAAQVVQLRSGLWVATIGSANNASELRGTLIQHNNGSDFDGDGSNDLAVFRPSTGTWYSQNNQGFAAIPWGLPGDQMVSGDFDGDGKTDPTVFRNQGGAGFWYVQRSSDNGLTGIQFGLGDDIAVRGDYDGDGRNDFAVFRPSNGNWYVLRSSNGSFVAINWGLSGDKPVASDFDGDGKTDLAVYRPSSGIWYVLRSRDNGFQAFQFGIAEDVPARGDFDGDGKADYAVFRPSTGVWYIWRSVDNSLFAAQFGASGDIPVAGGYDTDGKADIAVFRPSNGNWYVLRSSDGAFQVTQFGLSGDIPTSSR